MDIEKREQRNRLLLSYAEQAARLKAAAAANRTGGRKDAGRFDALCGVCDTHQRRAADLLGQLRAEVRRQLEEEGFRLQHLLERRRAAAGDLQAAVLAPAIARRRDRIARLNRVMAARNAAQAGGFVEMPLDEYARPARRKGEFSLTRTNLLIAAATAVLLLVAAGATYFATRPGGEVEFEARRVSARGDFIRVVVTNGLNEPIRLFVPWGAARPAADHADYGFDVFVRAPGEEEFRLLPDTGRAWIHEGRDFSLRESVEVAPKLRAEFRLNLDALRKRGAGFEAVRLVLTGAAGRAAGAAVFQ